MSAIAFVLHLIWEYAQCIPFFIHGSVKPTHTTMIRVTAGDTILTWVAYSAVALFHKDLYWFNARWRWTHWAILMIVALALSLSIEWYALKINRWAYTANIPLLFGHISPLPVLQLVLLFPATFLLLRRLINR
jgi:hypothetical protein